MPYDQTISISFAYVISYTATFLAKMSSFTRLVAPQPLGSGFSYPYAQVTVKIPVTSVWYTSKNRKYFQKIFSKSVLKFQECIVSKESKDLYATQTSILLLPYPKSLLKKVKLL